MKKLLLLLALSVSLVSLVPLEAQQAQLILTASPGQPVTTVSAAAVGPGGTATTLYYWVIARYTSGDALRTGPAPAFNTVGVAQLTSQSYVAISWSAMPGATSYDVLRSTTQAYPSPCAACAVAISTTANSANDQGGVLSAYPPAGRQPSTAATATFAVDNSGAVPFVGMNMTNGLGSNNYRLALISGTITSGNCVAATANSILIDSGLVCAGSGTTTIASGTAALGTSSISANVCATVVTTAATGVLSTDTISFTPNANISAVTGYGVLSTDGLKVYPYPTAGNVNFVVCNGTGSSITPGAVTLNYRVTR